LSQDEVVPAVVLIDSTGCRELDAVQTVLTGALKVPAVRVTGADLSSLRASFDLQTGVLTIGRRRVRPTVAWVRNAAARTLSESDSGLDQRRPFHAESWSIFLSQITATAAAAVPGAEPGRVDQLVDASRLGVSVPRTVVTTSARESLADWGPAKIVIKLPGSHFSRPRPSLADAYFAEVVDHADALPDWAESGSPVIVQEYVVHVRELRVYYLNGAVCALEVSKPSPASVWTAPHRTGVLQVECPRNVQDVVLQLTEAWKLTYGAFDVLVAPDGTPVFLEVNADGDWLWFERKAGWSGVTFIAATMVQELHDRATHAVAGS
jgi:hypothetical protein